VAKQAAPYRRVTGRHRLPRYPHSGWRHWLWPVALGASLVPGPRWRAPSGNDRPLAPSARHPATLHEPEPGEHDAAHQHPQGGEP
jgi:hypothetical protein